MPAVGEHQHFVDFLKIRLSYPFCSCRLSYSPIL
nr:MAG TPA: hypothetical protein [Caudoviricetes sp.]